MDKERFNEIKSALDKKSPEDLAQIAFDGAVELYLAKNLLEYKTPNSSNKNDFPNYALVLFGELSAMLLKSYQKGIESLAERMSMITKKMKIEESIKNPKIGSTEPK